jgi:2-polyprenyl-3-methyl-5-hydroxy-6-metoxy-1,4-benzoquinol methylase
MAQARAERGFAMTTTPTSIERRANKDAWPESQQYELEFWRDKWPYRDWPITDLQKLRHGDAAWFLSSVGFARKGEFAFEGFSGDVLEVGCGPIGFFELTQGVMVTAIDSLMGPYAAEIPFSTLGARGSTTYVAKGLGEITDQYRFVVCSNVLDHTADWMEFLELLVDRMRPDGELLLTTDTRSRPLIGHSQFFTPEQLRRAMKWLGLRTFECFRVEEQKSNHCDARVFARARFRTSEV